MLTYDFTLCLLLYSLAGCDAHPTNDAFNKFIRSCCVLLRINASKTLNIQTRIDRFIYDDYFSRAGKGSIQLTPDAIKYISGLIDGALDINTLRLWSSITRAVTDSRNGIMYIKYDFRKTIKYKDEVSYDPKYIDAIEDTGRDYYVIINNSRLAMSREVFSELTRGRLDCCLTAIQDCKNDIYYVICYGKIPKSYSVFAINNNGDVAAKQNVIALPTRNFYSGYWGHDVDLVLNTRSGVINIVGISSFGFYVESYNLKDLRINMKIKSSFPK